MPGPYDYDTPAAIRYNNPGAMWPGPSSEAFGSTDYGIIGGGNKIAKFDDPVNGAAAQFHLLGGGGYTGRTLADAIKKWSGGNSSRSYAETVSRETGLPLDAMLTPEHVRDPSIAIPLAKSAARWEAGREFPLSDDQWAKAHGLAFSGTAPPAALGGPPSSSPAGKTPMADSYLPSADAGDGYTDPEIIKLRARAALLAQEGRGAYFSELATKPLSKLGGLFGGLGLGFNNMGNPTAQSEAMLRGNEKVMRDYMRGASGLSSDKLAPYLMQGPGPLAGKGLDMTATLAQHEADRKQQFELAKQKFEFERKLQLELKREEQRQKLEDFDTLVKRAKEAQAGGQTPPLSPTRQPTDDPTGPPTAIAGTSIAASTTAPPAAGGGSGTGTYSPAIMGPALASQGITPPAAPAVAPIAAGASQPPAVQDPAMAAGNAQRKGPVFSDFVLGAGIASGMLNKEAAPFFAKDENKAFNEAYDAGAGKSWEEKAKGYFDTATKAGDEIAHYDLMAALNKNPALLTGPGAERFSIPLRKAAEFFNIKTEGLPVTQVFQALSNEMALQARNPAGGAGMPGSMSDSDREFLRNMNVNIGNTPEGNAMLLSVKRRVAQRQVDVAKLARTYARNNGNRLDAGFEDALETWREKNTIFTPQELATLGGGEAAREATPTTLEATRTDATAAVKDAKPGAVMDFGAEGVRELGTDGKWRPTTKPTTATPGQKTDEEKRANAWVPGSDWTRVITSWKKAQEASPPASNMPPPALGNFDDAGQFKKPTIAAGTPGSKENPLPWAKIMGREPGQYYRDGFGRLHMIDDNRMPVPVESNNNG